MEKPDAVTIQKCPGEIVARPLTELGVLTLAAMALEVDWTQAAELRLAPGDRIYFAVKAQEVTASGLTSTQPATVTAGLGTPQLQIMAAHGVNQLCTLRATHTCVTAVTR